MKSNKSLTLLLEKATDVFAILICSSVSSSVRLLNFLTISKKNNEQLYLCSFLCFAFHKYVYGHNIISYLTFKFSGNEKYNQ